MPSAPRHGGRGALLAALLASALLATGAQQASPGGGSDAADAGQDQQVSTTMVALLAAVVAVFVFIAASTIYLRHCTGRHGASSGSSPGDGRAGVVIPSSLDAFFSSRSWWQRRRGQRPRGLDAEAVEAFPTMTYAEAKALRVAKGGGGALECAVCLCEFEDGDRIRLLLPRCCHAFHPDCIAEWLAGHVTCPVCRCNLQPAASSKDDTGSDDSEEPTSFPSIPPLASSISSETAAAWQRAGTCPVCRCNLQPAASSKDDTGSDDSEEPTSFPSIPPLASSISSETAAAWQRAGPLPVAVVIDVATEEEEEARRQEALDLHRIGTQRRAMRRSPSSATQLAARLDRDLERFTLRLPEHVRSEMVAAAAAESSSHLRRGRRRRAAEGSSAPLVGQMGRWQSLLGRTFSGRLSFFSASRVTASFEGGEVSSSSSYYTRLTGKRVAAVDAAAAADVRAEGSIRLDRVGVGGSGSGAKASSVAADEEKART